MRTAITFGLLLVFSLGAHRMSAAPLEQHPHSLPPSATAGSSTSAALTRASRASDRGLRLVQAGWSFDTSYTWDLALGDLDGDGRLDVFTADTDGPKIWFNRGGRLQDSGQRLNVQYGSAVALGDLDGDGDLDAFVGSLDPAATIWSNDGHGTFTNIGQARLTDMSGVEDVALADLDHDGDLDAVEVFCGEFGGGAAIWLNDGQGHFRLSTQRIRTGCTSSVAIGDLDHDNHPDLILGNAGSGSGIEIWHNTGTATFTQRQILNSDYNLGLALGDLDGDGDLDIFVANGNALCGNGPDRVWLNNGDGTFADSGQRLGNDASSDVALADLDGDGDLDAFVTNSACDHAQPNKVWLNDGRGHFTDAGQDVGNAGSNAVAIGDLDRNGTPDVVVANFGANRVYFNPSSRASRSGARITVALQPSTHPEVGQNSIIAYSIVIANRGLGSARNVNLLFPFDPARLRVVDARFSRAGAWVSAVLPDAIRIQTGSLGSQRDVITATVRLATAPDIANDTSIDTQLTYSWSDAVAGGAGRSNRVALRVGTSAAGEVFYPLAVEPVNAPAASRRVVSSTLFVPGEAVALWLNTPDGHAVALGTREADANGVVRQDVGTAGFAPGDYSLVAYGTWTGFTAVGPLQVR